MLVPAMFLAGVILVPACSGGDAKENTSTAQNETKTPATKAPDPSKQVSLSADPSKGVAVSPLLNPSDPKMNETAPATYKARFETSKGNFVIEVHRDWAPLGADRFYNLVKNGFYNDVRFFRVLKGFMAQFGISGDAKVSSVWRDAKIQDDPVVQKNSRGMVSYAMAGPNTRTTQLFINFGDNSGALDGQGFSPFGQVVEGMEIVDALHGDYGEGAPRGGGPDQGRIQTQRNEYLNADFPNLDYVKKATIVTE
jgi:peptidyl-prolyl cis-trans isomerase A (cyclophilin A)